MTKRTMETLYCICVVLLFLCMQYSASFLLETSTNVASNSAPLSTMTGLPTTFPTSSKTTRAPSDADKEYQAVLPMVMNEAVEGVKLKTRLEQLKQNITGKMASFQMELNKRNINGEKQLNATETVLENTIKQLKHNVKNITTGSELLKSGLSNVTGFDNYRQNEFGNYVYNLSIAVKSNKEETKHLQHTAGTKSGFTINSPESGEALASAKFNTIISNIGNEFNISDSQFVCDQPGLYVFSLILYKTGFANTVICSIRHNGASVIQTYLNPNTQVDYGFYSSGNSILLRLAKDDIVDVGGCSDLKIINTLNHRTSLTGFLLKADV